MKENKQTNKQTKIIHAVERIDSTRQQKKKRREEDPMK